MILDKVINDGNFSLAMQNGPDTYEFPFASQGDLSAVIVKRKLRCDWLSFRASTPMERVNVSRVGTMFLVEAENPTYAGNGLFDWTVTLATVPNTREVPGDSIVYSFQFVITTVSDSFTPETPDGFPTLDSSTISQSIAEFPLVQNTVIKYEYFLSRPNVLTAPKIVQLGTAVYYLGDWTTFKPGNLVLAQDSEVTLYRGLIYQRKSIFIVFQGFRQYTK